MYSVMEGWEFRMWSEVAWLTSNRIVVAMIQLKVQSATAWTCTIFGSRLGHGTKSIGRKKKWGRQQRKGGEGRRGEKIENKAKEMNE